MKQSYKLLQNVSHSNVTVLIRGESGVGKEIFSRNIHERSSRHKGPFVAINCASIPPSLLETELFGCERGAYTSAISRRLGKFELAQGGTLLLDEVSEMETVLQAKLLRVLQEREIYRVGGDQRISLDVRVLATTNRDLKDWVRRGNMREDLYYRLNVISIHIPPLRERVEDIPVLAHWILARVRRDHPLRVMTFSKSALAQLSRYSWPGNIRELENVIVRSAFLSEGESIEDICFDDLNDAPIAQSQSPMIEEVLSGTVEEMERKMIEHALIVHGGNRVRAASALGISIRTMRNKLRQYRENGHLSMVSDDDSDHCELESAS